MLTTTAVMSLYYIKPQLRYNIIRSPWNTLCRSVVLFDVVVLRRIFDACFIGLRKLMRKYTPTALPQTCVSRYLRMSDWNKFTCKKYGHFDYNISLRYKDILYYIFIVRIPNENWRNTIKIRVDKVMENITREKHKLYFSVLVILFFRICQSFNFVTNSITSIYIYIS